MDKNKANAILADLKAAMKAVEEKHGVKITKHRGKFTDTSLSLTLEMGEVNGGVVESREYVALKAYYPNLVGKKFRHYSNGIIEFVGYNSRAHAYPLQYKTSDGKRWKAPTSMINTLKEVA
jgi:hypothetical protein